MHEQQDPRFPDEMTLVAAREVLRPLARTPKGHHCPVCRRQVKVYRRSLTTAAARGLHSLWLEHGRGYGHMPAVAQKRCPDIAGQAGYLVLAQHWGLMAERPPAPGVPHAGYWRVTLNGARWLRGAVAVPKYVQIYNGTLLGDPYGPAVTREDALGEPFEIVQVRDTAPPRGDQPELFAEAA